MRSALLSSIAFGLFLAAAPAMADTTTIHVGDRLARMDLLKPGVHRYVRYTITPDGHRNVIDIWVRKISFETVDGHKVLRIHQQWDEINPRTMLIIDADFDPDTFRPITEVRTVTTDGKTTVGGYRFLPDKIIGMSEVPDNSRKDFVQAASEPPFNWETDMEFLQALPLREGYEANVPFYDPGREPPGRYAYSVVGSDNIASADGGQIDCWVVRHEFADGKSFSRFWIAKGSQVLVREESKTADGNTLVKALLNPEDGDSG